MRRIPEASKVIVDGVNIAKRTPSRRGATMQGGIIDKDMPLPVSTVAHRVPEGRAHPQSATRFDDDGTQDPRLPQVRKELG